MKLIKYVLLLFLVTCLIPIHASAQLVANYNGLETSQNKTWKFVDLDSTKSRQSENGHSLQVMAMVDFSNLFLFQSPAIGGMFFWGQTFGLGATFSQQLEINEIMSGSGKIKSEGSILTLHSSFRPKYFEHKLVFSCLYQITLIDENHEINDRWERFFPISIGYYHDIGKRGGFSLQYDCYFVTKRESSDFKTNSYIAPSLKVMYQFY